VIKSPEVSVITSISLDHTRLLGNTEEEIAKKKRGSIKENSPVVLYPLNGPGVVDIVKNTANEKQSAFILPDILSLQILEENIEFTHFEYKGAGYKTKLLGRHQVYNAITAIEAANCLFKNSYNKIYSGIEKTYFPARFEILSKDPLVVFDGAHNISGIGALADTIKNLLPDKKIIFICGMLKDKNPKEALRAICAEPFVHKFFAVPVNSPRTETAENLCKYALKYCENAEFGDNLHEAVLKAAGEAAKDKNFAVVCFGSLYLAGEIKKSVKIIAFRE
jgi:dihydrofolate synthase/folylpolyglutamate synthase